MRLAFSATETKRAVERTRRRMVVIRTAFEKRHGNAPIPRVDDDELDRYLAQKNGSEVRYRWRDAKNGGIEKTLMLLAGWTCHPCMYTPVIPRLNENHRLITLENRGHWKSTLGRSNDGTYISDIATDANAALEAHRVEKVVLVGHSMGGLVSLNFTRRFPEKVAGIVMVCAPYTNPLKTWAFDSGSIVENALKIISYGIELSGPALDTVKRKLFADSLLIQELARAAVEEIGGAEVNGSFDKLFNRFMRTNSKAFAMAFRAMLRENGDNLDQLVRSDIPILAITGSRDVIVVSSAWEQIIDRMPNAKLVILPVGHLPTMEAPEQTARLISEFASGCFKK